MPLSKYLFVTTQSKIALEVVNKELKMLNELNILVVGILVNMRTKNNSSIIKELGYLKALALGSIDFDISFEDAAGDVKK